ncbi:MAG TPA: DUF4291 domain-containing protein [Clostridia bacterium]
MSETKEVYAVYNNKTIRVYQAYNVKIADEAVRLNKFGENFSLNRMTWIKPSFLWMMCRSNWGLKKDQERILAIDMLREGFDEYLLKAVLTTDESIAFSSHNEWDKAFKNSEVYCQWDPDRDVWGKPIGRKAIQIGIRGEAVKNYIDKWIVKISDITPDVTKWRTQLKNGCLKKELLPKEKVYPVTPKIREHLNMD